MGASNTLELNSEIENLKNSNKITLEHLEKEREYEICSLKNEFDSKIRQEQENLLRLRVENGIMKKKYLSMKNEIEELMEVIAKKSAEILKQQTAIRNSEKDIRQLKKLVEEREHTIEEKNKKNSALNKKNLELDKYKFVLEHRIEDLRLLCSQSREMHANQKKI